MNKLLQVDCVVTENVTACNIFLFIFGWFYSLYNYNRRSHLLLTVYDVGSELCIYLVFMNLWQFLLMLIATCNRFGKKFRSDCIFYLFIFCSRYHFSLIFDTMWWKTPDYSLFKNVQILDRIENFSCAAVYVVVLCVHVCKLILFTFDCCL